MALKKIRLGVVGYGSDPTVAARGRFLTKMTTENIEGVEAVGICDINIKALELAKKDFQGVPLYENFDKMLEEVSMDALLIETPAHLHAEFAVKAL